MNGKVTNFTHPVKTVNNASQSSFNPSVPKQPKFPNGKRKEKPGFQGSEGFPSSPPAPPLPPSPAHGRTRQPGDTGVAARAWVAIADRLPPPRAGQDDLRGRPRRGRPVGAPGQAGRGPAGPARAVFTPPRPGPPPPEAAAAPAAGLALPGRRLRPRRSPRRAGLPRRPPDTHRPARPNRGPGPGCRGRRARLLRAVPAARRPTPPVQSSFSGPLSPAGPPPFLLSSSSSASSPGGSPPRAPRPAPLGPAHPTGPGLGGGCSPGGDAHAEPGGDAHAESDGARTPPTDAPSDKLPDPLISVRCSSPLRHIQEEASRSRCIFEDAAANLCAC
ncbi:basic proline-rich protein-like [Panthera leo]|uniref:basic proline-rich protein-like n=1 Tax=Panthera leo TaxID=9689 RepID=UPI001C69E660|nr:basic proline-rich protein-like [Panthera leo]